MDRHMSRGQVSSVTKILIKQNYNKHDFAVTSVQHERLKVKCMVVPGCQTRFSCAATAAAVAVQDTVEEYM